MKSVSARRNFIRKSSLGLGSLALSQFLSSKNETKASGADHEKRLHIVCIGAHPGDPEFGCGGTMTRYAAAGHSVTFIYLTRGEAGDPAKSFVISDYLLSSLSSSRSW